MKTKYKPMNLEKEIEISKKYPNYIIKEYFFDGKKLVCIGIDHTANLNHPQFKIIKDIIEKENISIIILEISKEQFNQYRKTDKKKLFKEKDFIIKLAKEKKIPLVPGDLDMKEILLKNVKEYGKKNILILRVLVYLKNKKDIKKELSKIINHLQNKDDDFKRIFEDLKKEEKITNQSFKRIIEEFIILNNGKRLEEINKKDNIFPSPIENKTELNRIVRDISYKRDEYMIKKIFENLKKGDILFIAGKNHVIRQEPYLRDLEKMKVTNPLT